VNPPSLVFLLLATAIDAVDVLFPLTPSCETQLFFMMAVPSAQRFSPLLSLPLTVLPFPSPCPKPVELHTFSPKPDLPGLNSALFSQFCNSLPLRSFPGISPLFKVGPASWQIPFVRSHLPFESHTFSPRLFRRPNEKIYLVNYCVLLNLSPDDWYLFFRPGCLPLRNAFGKLPRHSFQKQPPR